jgi:hypothetical protein
MYDLINLNLKMLQKSSSMADILDRGYMNAIQDTLNFVQTIQPGAIQNAIATLQPSQFQSIQNGLELMRYPTSLAGISDIVNANLSILSPIQQIHDGILLGQTSGILALINSCNNNNLNAIANAQLSLKSLSCLNSFNLSVDRFVEVGLIEQNAALADRLLSPYKSFSEFSQYSAKLLEDANSDAKIRAIEKSVRLADAHLAVTSKTLSEFIVVPEDGGVVSAERNLVYPFAQQQEILDELEVSDDKSDNAHFYAPASQVAKKARKIMQLVSKCNKVALTSGKEHIFKPSTKVLEVFTDLPFLLPDSESSFNDFIDCLFFLLYEGAGTDKLRYLQNSGGILSSEHPVCEVIWCIKNLRNVMSRHNIERGGEAEIRKKWHGLQKHFKQLGLNHYPVTDSDFRTLHAHLLQECVFFLETLLNEMMHRESS